MIYAHELPYWKTGRSAAEVWIEKAKVEIKRAKGKVEREAFASENDKEAFLLTFAFGDDRFSIQWPVLPAKSGKDVDKRAAKVQAATMLYYDVKSRCVSARVLGVRSAFMGYLMLENGLTASQVSAADYLTLVPKVLMIADGR